MFVVHWFFVSVCPYLPRSINRAARLFQPHIVTQSEEERVHVIVYLFHIDCEHH